MLYEPVELRSTEWLARDRLHHQKVELVHIRVGTTKPITAEQDILRVGMRRDVYACGGRGFGHKIGGRRDANRANCRACLDKYDPKRDQPAVRQRYG